MGVMYKGGLGVGNRDRRCKKHSRYRQREQERKTESVKIRRNRQKSMVGKITPAISRLYACCCVRERQERLAFAGRTDGLFSTGFVAGAA